jgi:hypothetical protein
MEPDSTASTKTAQALLAALFAVNVYRAATQSVTPDEAETYNRFVGPPLREAFSVMTANNHVLNTLLEIISTSCFHLTDLALRLPSVLCGGLYLWAVYRLSRRTFGSGLLLLGAVALLTLNPLVLDHLSAARGYGMALAFWTWALVLMLEYPESGQPLASRKLKLAAVCLGLSVASNLAFIAPVVALACAFAVLLRTGQPGGPSRFAQQFAIPAFVTAFLVLVIPLNHADFATFTIGATSLRQTLNSITALSFFHGHPSSLSPVLAAGARVGLGLLVIAVVLAAAQILRRRPQGRVESLLVLLAGTMLLTFVTLQLAHRIFGAPFPVNGSALYFIPVATLAGLALVCKINRRPLWLGAVIVAALCIAGYLLQFNTRIYGEWPQYAEARSAVKAIRRDAGLRRIRIGASAGMDPVLNYYRARYDLGNWDAVNPAPLTGAYDYYVLSQQDAGLLAQRHLRLVFRGTSLIVAR